MSSSTPLLASLPGAGRARISAHRPSTRGASLLVLLPVALWLPSGLAPASSVEAQRGPRWRARGSVVVRPMESQVQVQTGPQPLVQNQVQVQTGPQPLVQGQAQVRIAPQGQTPVRPEPTPQPQWQAQRGAGVTVVGAPVVGHRPPPPMRVFTPPPPPHPPRWMPPPQQGGYWIEGHWSWDGTQWVWLDGRWELPPQPGAVWVPPSFNGRTWVAGYWSLAQTTLPPTARPYAIGAYVSAYLGAGDARDATGRPFHDYVVDLRRGQTVALIVSGGPADSLPNQRLWPTLQVHGRGGLLAQDVPTAGLPDARIVFTAPLSDRYTLRISTRMGTAATGTYVLESGAGRWTPAVSPYEQFWGAAPLSADVQVQTGPQRVWVQPPGGPQVVAQPSAQVQVAVQPGGGPQVWMQPPGGPQVVVQSSAQAQVGAAPVDCRRLLLSMGYAPMHAIHCEGAEPSCAEALLRAGHSPASLIHCQGVQPACAVATLRAGNTPAQLVHCR